MTPFHLAQVAQLQLEVRSLRALVAATEAAQQRPRSSAQVLYASITAAAGVVLTALTVMIVLPGTASPQSRPQSPEVP